MSLSEVRLRPGMYVGDTTDGTGLHNMVYEVVNNAMNEALSGFANRIDVTLNPNGSCTVRDNGRGIPTDLHPTENVSCAEVIFTRLHTWGSFGQSTYDIPGELHGVSVAVVNALSEWLELRIWRERREHHLRFAYGSAIAPLNAARAEGNGRGTEITFQPIKDIFADRNFDFTRISSRLRDLTAYLAAHKISATVTLRDERANRTDEVVYRA